MDTALLEYCQIYNEDITQDQLDENFGLIKTDAHIDSIMNCKDPAGKKLLRLAYVYKDYKERFNAQQLEYLKAQILE